MKPCFEEYRDERRPGFHASFGALRGCSIDRERERGCLGSIGSSAIGVAVHGYLVGCLEEADEVVEQGRNFLELATAIGERNRYDYTEDFSEGMRGNALAYLHWLATSEPHEAALAEARERFASYCSKARVFDRASANLMAPRLLFLESDAALVGVAERLSREEKATSRPGGLFGDAYRIALASTTEEKERLKAALRKRMPLHLFRWIHRGHYDSAAFVLHAIFPRPEGRPSRLIEEVWDALPEIERIGGYKNWDVKKKG